MDNPRTAEIVRRRQQEAPECPDRFSQLTEIVAEYFRLAEKKLAWQRCNPSAKQLIITGYGATMLASLVADGKITAKDASALTGSDPIKVAMIMQRISNDDIVFLQLCFAAAKAKGILDRSTDPEGPEIPVALDLLKIVGQAAQLCQEGAWQAVAGVMVELCANERFLEEMRNEPSLSARAVKQMNFKIGPAIEAIERRIKAPKRASDASAEQRLPKHKRRIQAFVQAIRSEPNAGAIDWATMVYKEYFGGSGQVHADNAARFYRRYRKEIQAELAADSPMDCPPVPTRRKSKR